MRPMLLGSVPAIFLLRISILTINPPLQTKYGVKEAEVHFSLKEVVFHPGSLAFAFVELTKSIKNVTSSSWVSSRREK
jgi:hypothetical protein